MKRAVYATLRLALLGLLACAASAEPTPSALRFSVSFETEDGFTIHGTLTSSGSASGPLAILLHIYGADRTSWDPLVPDLAAAGFTVLALDQRAHGESIQQRGHAVRVREIPRDEFGAVLRAGVKDVAAALAYLRSRGIATDRVLLVGASYGCSVSLLSAARFEGVRALVLLSPGTNYFGVDVRDVAKSFAGPLLAVAAEDDGRAASNARTLVAERSGPTEIVIYPSGGHGTRLFAPRPELRGLIVDFARKAVQP